MEKKVVAEYIDRGFGFPVKLLKVPMLKVRGHWTPRLNYNLLTEEVLRRLAELDGRLSGNHIRFIRLHFEMTLEQFAERFDVTHPAVKKWQSAANQPTNMSWSTEKDIRLFIKKQLHASAKEFSKLYAFLEKVVQKSAPKMELDARKLAA